MNALEHSKYWRPARVAFLSDKKYPDRAFHASIKLSALLGIDYKSPGYWKFIVLTDNQKSILSALSGQHAATILKMLEAQKHEPMGT